MAKKISQLTQATQVKSDDVTVIVQDGETKKLPLNMMVTKQDIENKKVAGLAKLDEIETTYENDTYTPTIAVKNKSSVKVGEGDGVDYSANVMDGHVKSAILKGNTLVNLCDKTKSVYSANGNKNLWQNVLFNTNPTQLTVINHTDKVIKFTLHNRTTDNWVSTTGVEANSKSLVNCGTNNYLKDLYGGYNDGWSNTEEDRNILKDGILILEGDYTDVNIPYFEGMQSVKLPVLTTTGKNLFDKSKTLENCALEGTSNVVLEGWKDYFVSDYIPVKKNVPIFIPYTGSSRKVYCDKNKEYVRQITNSDSYFTPEFDGFIRLTFINVDLNTYQLEYNTQATSYEPYKSNILSTPEDLELRGIGDVKDTLDLTTGELTQRIGEIVLDGSENWIKPSTQPTNTSRFLLVDFPNNKNAKILSNIRVKNNALEDAIGIWCDTNTVLNVDTSIDTVESLKVFLSENPIKLQYSLATESIKTVDLMPSGTHPSTTPYCWKNGHIQLSSSGLLPNLEYSVVTSRAGQINQNATMIVKNDKRIFDLEILLAGGLVNTTYQALTLQNQVETGLSKVSLNSETEPDYLLYHMIMKLIEEKAYKLDDLTEKVSVFYLYEKLSDEQFETIYSALYPFAEDEIIEEPVVEELPEVVEDEVIM